MTTLIRGGTLVLPEGETRADLLLENGVISAVGQDLTGDRVIDAAGKLIFPGFIDAHTHFEMNKGLPNETADDFVSGTRAAVSGGTTTILDFATQDRGDTLARALETWHSRADGRCACNYGFHMAITDWNDRTRREMADMTAAGVTSYKIYLAYDNLRVSDAAAFEILCAAGEQGALVSAHCENGDLVREGVARQKALGHLAPFAHPLSRPEGVEEEAVRRFLAIGEAAGQPVYVVHLSTSRGLWQALLSRGRGQEVYLETCPQYLLLNDDKYQLPGFESAKFVCSPPLRPAENSADLWGALSDGTIDTVATDHCSFNYAGPKQLGKDDFSLIPNGMPGTETRPALMYTYGVLGGRLSTADMARLLSEQPAKLFGMWPQKGVLRAGSDADVVIWDPAYRGVVSAEAQVQNVDYSPFEGTPVSGRAEAVWVGGEPAVEHGAVLDTAAGKYVSRGPSLRYRRV